MNKIIYILISLLIAISAEAEITIQQFSSYPTQEYVFTAWGHSAVRVLDDEEGTDIVYNYGVFSFDDVAKFVVYFVKGDTDYQLEARHFFFGNGIWRTMGKRGVPMRVQTLDLTQEEAKSLKKALEENASDPNWRYRYNFFYDNCATRPRLMIEENAGVKVDYHFKEGEYRINSEKMSYRDIIHKLLDKSLWYACGIDFCLGAPTEEVPNDSLMMFLPLSMAEAFASATITDSLGTRSLVSNDYVEQPETLKADKENPFPTPITFFSVLLALAAIHTLFYGWLKKDDYVWFDFMLYGMFGLFGLLGFFLCFISTHPCVCPNYNLLWANPLHFLIPIFIMIKPLRRYLKWVYGAFGIMALIALCVPVFGLQVYNSAFFLIIPLHLLRAGSYWMRYGGKKLK